jgi:hemerythrin HHE cation binding domain-containing protein
VAKKATRRKTAAKKTAKTRARRATAKAAKRHKATKSRNAARAAAARKKTKPRGRKAPQPKKPSALSSAATAVKGSVKGAVAAVKKRLPGATASMDAITLLEADHRRLESLFKQGEDTTERAVKGRRELLATLSKALTIHEMIEEKVLYPALKEFPEARDIVLEGFQEHHVADLIAKELEGVSTTDEQWGAKFKVLKENIEHHIQEEEGPMFRTARGVMPADRLELLGARMAKMKADAEAGR